MKRLNLIPRDLRFGMLYQVWVFVVTYQAKVVASTAAVFLALVVFVLVVQSVSIYVLKGKIERERRGTEELKAKVESSKLAAKQYTDMQDYLARVTEFMQYKISYLAAVKDRPAQWSVILQELRRYIPKRVWLYGLSTDKGQMKIEGGTFDEDLVSAFMNNLKESVSFSGVNFNYTRRTKIGAAEVVNFEIVCNYNLEAALQ